jgi:hypothetical protein
MTDEEPWRDDDEWREETPDDWWTLADMERFTTPRQAAHVKHWHAVIMGCAEPDPHLDELIKSSPGHMMWCYYHDVIARRAPTLGE